MTTHNVKGVRIEIIGADEHGRAPGALRTASGMQTAQLLRSLDRLPREHLVLLPRITVGERPPATDHPRSYGGGGSAHRGMPGGPYLRLNWRIFQAPWNQGFLNNTILHEVGHIVDWAYGCMDALRIEHRTHYRALISHPHSGRTQGPSEHYADAYADYFIGHRMSNARQEALLASRAFQPVQSLPPSIMSI